MKSRVSIVRLSTEDKPTSGIEDGSLLYLVDTKDIYIFYKGSWYKQTEDESEG